MGGFCHSLYWYFAVPLEDAPVLNAPLLECIADAFNFIAFCDYVLPLVSARDSGCVFVQLTDALSLLRSA